MRIQTTAGVVSAEQDRVSPTDLVVKGSPEALQAVIDGVQMSGGGEPGWRAVDALGVTKKQFAIWVQFEILNYLTYTDADVALGDTMSDEDGIATP